MANFCGKCGSATDAKTGLCPNCDRDKLNNLNNRPKFCTYCGTVVDAQSGICPNPACRSNQAPTATGVAPADTTAPSAPKTAKKSFWNMGKATPLNVLVLVLLSICLFLTSFAAILLGNVKSAFSESCIENIIEDISIMDLLNESGDLDNDLDRFYNYLERHFDIKANDGDIEDIINKSTLKSFIAKKTAGFFDEFFENDTVELYITKDEISNLLKENRSVLNKELDTDLTTSQLMTISDWLFDEEQIYIMGTYEIKEAAPTLYDLSKTLLSGLIVIILAVISLAIIFFMLKICLLGGITASSVTFIVTGGILLIIASLPSLLGSILGINEIITNIIGTVLSTTLIMSIILLVVGIGLLILKKFLFKSKKQV